jgi:hypothetical protein
MQHAIIVDVLRSPLTLDLQSQDTIVLLMRCELVRSTVPWQTPRTLSLKLGEQDLYCLPGFDGVTSKPQVFRVLDPDLVLTAFGTSKSLFLVDLLVQLI